MLDLFVFIDAFGFAVHEQAPIFAEHFPAIRPLRSVLGYSSACVPSILSGRTPQEHLHWSYFTKASEVASAGTPGIQVPWWIKAMPAGLRDRGRVRRHLSKAVARCNQIEGYFQLYQMPIDELGHYGHCEPKNIFTPGGLNRGDTIIDEITAAGVPAWISDWHQSAEVNWQSLEAAVTRPELRFALMYDAELDGWLHQHGKEDDGLAARLRAFLDHIQQVQRRAETVHGDSVRVHVFSDHGMCTIREHLNPFPLIDQAGPGVRTVCDSTMIRAWYRDDAAQTALRLALANQKGLRLLSRDELQAEGCNFADNRFFDDVWLADPGVLLVPSHMGRVPMTGMHGFHPSHEDSNAIFCSTDPSLAPQAITDLRAVMSQAVHGSPALSA